MSLIGAAVLALVMQPAEEASVLTDTAVPREYDQQLKTALTLLIATAEIGPDGQLLLAGPMGDERFLQQNSGRYWQISGEGQEAVRSFALEPNAQGQRPSRLDGAALLQLRPVLRRAAEGR